MREREALRRACFHKVMFVRFLYKNSLIRTRKKHELTMKFYSKNHFGSIVL